MDRTLNPAELSGLDVRTDFFTSLWTRSPVLRLEMVLVHTRLAYTAIVDVQISLFSRLEGPREVARLCHIPLSYLAHQKGAPLLISMHDEPFMCYIYFMYRCLICLCKYMCICTVHILMCFDNFSLKCKYMPQSQNASSPCILNANLVLVSLESSFLQQVYLDCVLKFTKNLSAPKVCLQVCLQVRCTVQFVCSFQWKYVSNCFQKKNSSDSGGKKRSHNRTQKVKVNEKAL